MAFLIVAGGLLAVCFALVFVARRRYGVMALALAAGAMMSTLWVGDLTPLVAKVGVVSTQPPLEAIVAAGLTLIPALLVLVSGPAYGKGKGARLLGGIFFGALAVLLLLEPIQSGVVIDSMSRPIVEALVNYKPVGVTFLLVLAVADVWATRTAKPLPPEGKH